MKLLFILMFSAMTSWSYADENTGPKDLGEIKSEDIGIVRLPDNYFYYIDRKNQTCFTGIKEMKQSRYDDSYTFSGLTMVNCDLLRNTPEIDKFLKSGKEM